MKRILLIIILLLVQSINGICQKSNNIHYLNIAQYTPEIELTELNFSIKEVVDKTDPRGNYGFIQKGFSNKRKKILFQNGIQSSIIKYFNHRYLENPYGTPIKMEIHSISISEKTTGFGETGKIELHIQYFQENQIVSTYSNSVDVKAMDVTKENIKTLDTMLNESFIILSRELHRL